MELLLRRVIVIKLTNFAVVVSEDLFALLAGLVGYLDCGAIVALDRFHLLRIKRVWYPRFLLLLLLTSATLIRGHH